MKELKMAAFRNLSIPKLILRETVIGTISGTVLKPLFPEH